MYHPHEAIDCRGLPAHLAVLRIMQALLTAPAARLQPLAVRLSENCARDDVASGLRAAACDVRLFSGDKAFPRAERKSYGTPLTDHV